MGSVGRDDDTDYSDGVAIGAVFQADAVTNIEPVRYPHGSGLMRFLAWPLIDGWTRRNRNSEISIWIGVAAVLTIIGLTVWEAAVSH